MSMVDQALGRKGRTGERYGKLAILGCARLPAGAEERIPRMEENKQHSNISIQWAEEI